MKKIIRSIRFLCWISALLLSIPHVQAQPGLIARYKFDGNTSDASGNGFNGIISDPAPTYGLDRFGFANSALNAQSASDAVLVPAAAFTNFNQGTVSMWVKTTEAGGSSYYWACPTLFGSDVSGYNDTSWAVYINSGAVGLWGQLNGLGQANVGVFQSTKIINDNFWHFIVVTINDDTLSKLYVDDTLIGSIVSTTPMAQRAHMIMDKGPSGGYPTTGLVDDVRVNSRVLRTTEIDSLYRGLEEVTTTALAVNIGADAAVCTGSYIIFDPVVTGGTAPYSYAWSSTGDTLNCTNCQHPSVTLSQNSSYVLAVQDAHGTLSFDTINLTVTANNSTLQSAFVNTGISCANAIGTSVVTVSGGTAPYLYHWGDGSSADSAGTPATHQFSSGSIFVFSVSDSFGCVTSAFDTISDSAVTATLSLAVQPNCVYDSTGKIVITASGGNPPYTYHWITGQTVDSIDHLSAGDYAVTVSDVNSCSTQFVYNLSPGADQWNYYVYLTSTDANCTNNGTITATVVSGGNNSYWYLWSNGDTTAIIDSLGAGTYNLTVTDSSGCTRPALSTINYNCVSVISGVLFIDTNNNCIFDAGEQTYSYVNVGATGNGQTYYGCTDQNGRYTITVPDSGTYVLSTYLFYDFTGVCANVSLCGDSTQTIFIGHLGDSSLNNNFGVSGSSGFDLTIHPGWTSADPGFQKRYWVMPYNQSSSTYTGQATVVFNYDSNLIYQYSLPPLPTVDSVNHTLTWQVSNLPSPWWDWDNVRFQNFFLVPSSVGVGQLLYSSFSITPTAGDCDSSNNFLSFSETCIGSHDPNEKSVVPANNISPDDSVLTYTIAFQNTGTDSTYFILVKDTLSPDLDAGTVRNIASSHPYSGFKITGNGILIWTFSPLRLVDSITNARGSQGFITFSIKKRKNLPLGTTITNNAYVYFDYNPAVITNTVTDTVAIPSAISTGPSDNNGEISVVTYPNPFNDFTNFIIAGITQKFDFGLYDMTGRLERRILSINTSKFQLRREDLSSGVYLYRITTGATPNSDMHQIAFGKIVIQ